MDSSSRDFATTARARRIGPDSYYLHLETAAALLKTDVAAVERLIAANDLSSVKISGEDVRIPLGTLEAFIELQRTGKVRRRTIEVNPIPEDDVGLLEAANAFAGKTGHDPFSFTVQWRDGQLEDTGENVSAAIEALALRASLIDAGSAPTDLEDQ